MKKDFSKKSYRNPRHQKQEKHKAKTKKILAILIALIIISTLIYLILFSPLFKITKITISGTNKAGWQNNIQELIKQQQTNRFLFIQQSNLIFFNQQQLQTNISNQFDINYIKITKNYPHTLKIEIQQKIPALLWLEQGTYYTIDQAGLVDQQINFDQFEFDLPLVSFATATQISVGQNIIPTHQIQFITQLHKKSKKYFKNWEIKKFEVTYPLTKTITAQTSQNWEIFFNSELDIDTQINNLKELIKEKIPDTAKLEYIDLRLGDRLFYK